MKLLSKVFSGFLLLGSTATGHAQSVETLQTNMNTSSICSPLSFDGANIADIFDPSDLVKVALKAVNTKVAWDKNFHKVNKFTVVDGNVSVEADLGCQPSPEGAGAQILEIMGVGVEKLQLNDKLTCSGALTAVTCQLTGEIGKYLGQQNDISGTMQTLISNSLQ